ncbi:hemolysin family protein [Saccharicrinis sp. FJH54]|uniref:hemolysin family protein n=1 Tax=Saccharicrinis sp. FJH54 TaxID=3344665 RepID=UPI0035D4AD9D
MSSLATILITVTFSAFFSGMEIAFVASNKLRFEIDRQKGQFTSNILSIFYEHPQQFIATMLVGNNIALVIYSLQMAKVLEPVFFRYVDSGLVVLLLQTIFSTLIILFTAEFLPKTVFRLNPNLSLKLLSIPLILSYIVLYPVASFSSWASAKILRIFRVRFDTMEEKPVFGRIELNNLLEETYENTNGDSVPIDHDVKIFQNALDFSRVKLRECVIPRTEVVAVDIDSSLEDLKQRFIETGLSKIVIYKENIDHVVGYVHSSELFKNPKTLRSRIMNIPIVPETMAASKLLKVFMQEKRSIAVVVDEFGGTSGIVTLEDIMEEIFGEIEDEHDSTDLQISSVGENEYILSGRVEIDNVNEKLNLELPKTDDFETVAGLILYHYENLPKVNDIIDIGKFKFKILKATENKIELVKLTVIQ